MTAEHDALTSSPRASRSSTPRRPDGPIETRWERRRFGAKLVNPANRRKLTVIVVGTGLAGGSAAATLGRARLPGQVATATRTARAARTRSPRRAASTPPRTTATTATRVHRLFYDTVKGGDFRSRESNVLPARRRSRSKIIDQCVAQGVPFAREYGGLLDTRSFGGAQVSRTFYARGQTGQQLLLGAYQALERQIAAGTVEMHTRHEMLELIVVDGRARGIVVRDMVTGEIEHRDRRRRRARLRRLRQRLLPVHQRQGLQRHRHLAGAPQGRAVRQPLLHPDPPDLHPASPATHQSKLTLMSESLRNDGRVWVPVKARRRPRARRHPRGRARLLPGADLPVVRQPGAPRHRLPRRQERLRRGPRRRPRRARRLPRLRRRDRAGSAATPCEAKYGNLFEMYERITGEDPYAGADAHLPGRALHDGRAVGRLRPAVHDPRPVRDRRGELLRPRRQPARRVRADAGPRRRLLRAAEHDQRLPRPGPLREARRRPRGRRGGPYGGRGPDRAAAGHRRRPHRRTRSTASSAASCGSTAAWSAPTRACARRSDRIRELRDGVLERRQGAGRRRGAQPGAGEGRPGRRLLRAGRADVRRRAAPHRVLRRPLPRREPDPRRRGAARRRRTSPTSPPGSSPAPASRRCCTRKT